MMNFSPSLVKYSTPVLISTGVRKEAREPKTSTKAANYYDKKVSLMDKTTDIWDWIQDMEHGQTIEEILNTIIAPREYHLESQGQVWIQTAISVPATRIEVVQLQDELHKRLKKGLANETGICPVREELYSQCFDELIRQIIISFKKRGLLLACVRDQINMTVSSYRKLYESSIAFGIRKAVNADKSKLEMRTNIENLDSDCNRLQREVDTLRSKIENAKKEQEESKAKREKEHQVKVNELRATNDTLKDQLESTLDSKQKPKKKK